MDENQNDELEVLNQEEESDFTQTDGETVEELRQKLENEQNARAKAEEIARNQKIRAEKAEGKVKTEVAPQQTVNQGDISQKDLYAMSQANVSIEDFDEVVEYAKFKNLSVIDALKSTALKAILSEKTEQRNTARATSTGSSKRASYKASDEALLENFKKGVVPESDEDIARLVKLRSR